MEFFLSYLKLNTAVLPYTENGHNIKKKKKKVGVEEKQKQLLKGYPKSFAAKGRKLILNFIYSSFIHS